MHFSANTFIYNPTHSLTKLPNRSFTLSATSPQTLIQLHRHSLTKWPYRLQTLSLTSPFTHSFTVPRIHLPNHPVACLRSVTFTHTQSITVPRIHLSNDNIAYLTFSVTSLHTQLQSHAFICQMITPLTDALSHFPTHSLNYGHTRSLTKYSSTYQFVKHSKHLHTKTTHPLTHPPTHNHSLYFWPFILLGYSLPCLFSRHATRSQIHVLVQPLS
jgi:hypothetical protein